MYKRLPYLTAFLLWLSIAPTASAFSISGTVRDARSGAPLPGAAVQTEGIWHITDLSGNFKLEGLGKGAFTLKATLLGYAGCQKSVRIADRDIEGIDLLLSESSLALEGVTVTASRPKDGTNTTRNIGRDALNQLQVTSLADMTSLLPGGKTVNPDLTTSNILSIRSGGSTAGNASFGTAVEVDGVRLSTNAGLGEMSGADTRSVAVENIESIEVITGVPSAEYGDLASGIVRIHTKRGRSPLHFTASVNPRTYQASVSKGIGIGSGALNVSAEWARATSKLTSPYSSYTRRNLGLTYSGTFAKVFRFEAGVNGNIGGMDSKDDPDAITGCRTTERANVLRANSSLTWLLNRSWITNLKIDASASFADNLKLERTLNYFASKPAVHSELEGYYPASTIKNGYADCYTDSKELDFSASVKYTFNRSWGEGWKSQAKAGVQWKAEGNVGEGEYYTDILTAPDGYRPRPYSQYPFMHNTSLYAEERLTIPAGHTNLELTAGLRQENISIKGTKYQNTHTLSPRLNAKWTLAEGLSIRGGWGISEKMPSFNILYPKQEYIDKRVFSTNIGGTPYYVYCTHLHEKEYNPDLKWQKNINSEVGLNFSRGGFELELVGFYNITRDPYMFASVYVPVTYNIMPTITSLPAGTPVSVDPVTGIVTCDGTPLEASQEHTFMKTARQSNGQDIRRGGVELTLDFPKIKAIRTAFRVDATYNWTDYTDQTLLYYYPGGTLGGSQYPYVGVYAASSGSVVNGKWSRQADANLTSVTHIPEAKLVITCKVEACLFNRCRNLSLYDGGQYAAYAADGKPYVQPLYYLTTDGEIHPFTAAEASNPDFDLLKVRSGNAYTLDLNGYGTYLSANINITKEIGTKVSLSVFANNFTQSRMAITWMSNGISQIITPQFYYGITCRIKL